MRHSSATQEIFGVHKGQCIDEWPRWTKGGALLALLLTDEQQFRALIVNVSLGCSYHTALKFKIPREVRKACSRAKITDFTLFVKPVN